MTGRGYATAVSSSSIMISGSNRRLLLVRNDPKLDVPWIEWYPYAEG